MSPIDRREMKRLRCLDGGQLHSLKSYRIATGFLSQSIRRFKDDADGRLDVLFLTGRRQVAGLGVDAEHHQGVGILVPGDQVCPPST
jgi:hypothetical protein